MSENQTQDFRQANDLINCNSPVYTDHFHLIQNLKLLLATSNKHKYCINSYSTDKKVLLYLVSRGWGVQRVVNMIRNIRSKPPIVTTNQ